MVRANRTIQPNTDTNRGRLRAPYSQHPLAIDLQAGSMLTPRRHTGRALIPARKKAAHSLQGSAAASRDKIVGARHQMLFCTLVCPWQR
jgi:hypothetical protein